MGTYLMMMYVSLEQELAVKDLFTNKGWGFKKPDLRITTEDIGPLMEETVQTEIIAQAPCQEMVQTQTVVQMPHQVTAQTQPDDIVQTAYQEMPIIETFSQVPSQQEQQAQRVEKGKRPKRTPKRNPKYEQSAVDPKSAQKVSKVVHVEKYHPKVKVNIDKQTKDAQEISEFQEILQEAEMITASLNDIEKENNAEHVNENQNDNAARHNKVKTEQYSDGDDIADFDSQVKCSTAENTGKLDLVPSSSKFELEEASVGTSASGTSSSKKRKLTGKIAANQGETKKSRKKRQYDVAQMSKAYHAVIEKKMSVYKASREYGIPESTLRDRFLSGGIQFDEDKLPAVGGARLFEDEEERALVEHFNHMNYLGYGYSRKDMILMASDYAVSLNKYPTGSCLANSWYTKFKRRYPDINPKKQQKVSLERANATSAGTVHIYYTNLKAILDTADIKSESSSIYILDEITLPMEQNAADVYVKTDFNESGGSDEDKQSFTLIGCGNASGSLVPPYLVLPGRGWNDSYLEGTCAGSSGECSEDGDTNALVFSNYFNNHFRKFVPFGKDNKPVIVLYDGQKSNLMLILKTFGEENNIIFFVLPPHASCITGLNLDCFHPLAEVFNKESQLYLRKKNELSLENMEVGRLVSKAYLETMTPATLTSAFKCIGVYPFDSGVVRHSDSDLASRAVDFTGFLDRNELQPNSDEEAMLDN